MIELLPESFGNVIGFRIGGMITEDDLSNILIPTLEEASERHGILRLVIEIFDYKGEELGARLEDLFDADRKTPYIEREAIIGEEGWDKWDTAYHDFFFVFQNTETRFFNHDRRRQAWDWIREGTTADRT